MFMFGSYGSNSLEPSWITIIGQLVNFSKTQDFYNLQNMLNYRIVKYGTSRPIYILTNVLLYGKHDITE